MLFNRILALASIPCYGMVRAAKNRQNVSGGERLGHFGGPFWATPFPLARGSQNGPRPQGFASPRNNGAPLTATKPPLFWPLFPLPSTDRMMKEPAEV